MATYVRGGLTTYTTDVTGGLIPPGQVIRDLRRTSMAIEPRDTPFLTTVGYGGPVDQEKHEWARRAFAPLEATIAAGGYASGATTLTVTAGHGVRFAKYMVLQVDDEVFWVTGTPTTVAPDDVPVVGAQGGTSAANHAAAATVTIIGTAMPQLEDYALSPWAWGDQYYNVPQRFTGAIKTDRRADVTPNTEISNRQHDERVRDELRVQKHLLERTLFRGRRQAGSPAPTAVRPSLMGGLEFYMTTNTFNKNAGLLDIYHIEEALVTLRGRVGNAAARQIFMNVRTHQIISRLLNGRRQGTMQDTSANLVWNNIGFVTGQYSFSISEYVPDGRIYVINTRDCKVFPYKGLGWHERELPVFGEHLYHGVGGDFTAEFTGEKAWALIYNFDTNIANYPVLT